MSLPTTIDDVIVSKFDNEHEGFKFCVHRHADGTGRSAWWVEVRVLAENIPVPSNDLLLVPAFRWRGFYAYSKPDDTVNWRYLHTPFYDEQIGALNSLLIMVEVLKELGVKP